MKKPMLPKCGGGMACHCGIVACVKCGRRQPGHPACGDCAGTLCEGCCDAKKLLPAPTSYDEQLTRWVEGDALHMDLPDLSTCTPDFGCCNPTLLATKDVRERFAVAYRAGEEGVVMHMLGMFMGAGLKAAGAEKHVHIVGTEPKGSA